MTSESTILRAIHLRIGARSDVRLFRQNVGVAYPMGGVRRLVAAVLSNDLAAAKRACAALRPVKFGTPGQSDLTGIVAGSGRRLEIECKSEKGRESKEQIAYGAMIVQFGGIYIVGRSDDQAETELEKEL